MKRARVARIVRALVPTGVGLVLGVVLALLLPGRRVVVSVSPALLALELGVLTSAALLVRSSWRRRARARREEEVSRVREEGEQARRRFIRRLDHELKNPLTALLTALGGPPGPLAASDREVTQAQADRIRRLLTDLRRVADVETVDLESDLVDVGELLSEAADLAVADGGTGRAVRVDVPAAPWPLPKVPGDRDLLLVAVYNVVANAVKYTSSEDVIEVRARERTPVGGGGGGVSIEVADTGPGVPVDEQQVVWEELARSSTATQVPGSGIGLALVRVIVQRHGGSVEMSSRYGHGTSVFLHLPTAG